jgi:hypothetical protein
MRVVPSVTVTPVASPGGINLNLQDGSCGVVLTGAGSGALALLKPIMVVSLADAITKGVTTAAEPEAYKLVKEFYSVAPKGSPFYLMLVANTVSLVSLCDITNTTNGAKKLVDFAQGKLRAIGIMRTPAEGYTPVTAEFVDSDAHLAMANAVAFQQSYFAAHTPLRIMLGFRVADITSETIYDPSSAANNAVLPVIGDTANGGLVGMGLILGRFAATTAEINIGRNSDGGLPITNFYIGTLPSTPPADGSAWYEQINTLIGTGYCTVTIYAQFAGYFISDDPMATNADADNVNNLADARIQDKAAIIAYQTYIRVLKSNVDINSDGTVNALSIKDLESQMYNNIMLNMGSQISGVPTVYIDPTQVFAPGTPLNIALGVTRKGCLRQININLALS